MRTINTASCFGNMDQPTTRREKHLESPLNRGFLPTSVCRSHRPSKVDSGTWHERSDGLDPVPMPRFPSTSAYPYDDDRCLEDSRGAWSSLSRTRPWPLLRCRALLSANSELVDQRNQISSHRRDRKPRFHQGDKLFSILQRVVFSCHNIM